MPDRFRTTHRAYFVALSAILGLVVMVTAVGAAVPGADQSSAGGVSSNPNTAVTDFDDLEAFIDPIFAADMVEYDIPGAAFVLVNDGEIALSKGYGYADRENQIPVNPERTIFDLGSIGKLFTATAVMQLVEQGQIDLHTDVNEYLSSIEVPDTFDDPITMHHLLTHTAGFDERFFVLGIAPGPYEITPLDEHLRENLPPRIRPPGQFFQYSNAGITLAGLIVEEISGQTFEAYVTANVLEPLGMENSTYGLPEELVPQMAMGYEGFPDTTFSPYESWHLNERPAAGVRATVDDMTAFMLTHLNGGEFDGARILDADTLHLMHSTQFTPHPDVPAMAYGFWEHRAGDRRGIHHGGQWVGFSNLLYLLPEEDLGIIVSYNHGSAIYVQSDLVEAILDRFYPSEPISEAPAGSGSASLVEGRYRTTRVDNHTFFRLPATLTAQTLEVEENADGSIEISMSPSFVSDGTWVEIEPGIYGELGGTNTIAFHLEGDDDAEYVHFGWPLQMTMERIAWYHSAGLHLGLLVVMLIAIASTIAWPVGRLYRGIRGRRMDMPENFARARLLGGIVAALLFTFLVGLLVHAVVDIEGMAQIPVTLQVLFWLPIIALVMSLGLLVFLVRALQSREGPLVSRVHLTVLVVALVAFFPFLYYWNLLGFNF